MTHHILRIDASARRTGSVSRALNDRLIARFGAADVTTRDLAATPLPLIDEDWVGANFTAPEDRSETQRAALALSDALVAELRAADTIVIGLPIYNFSVPAGLKAWIDLVARAGETFAYTAEGPQGLLSGKRVIVTVASGGVEPGSDYDYATTYLSHVLGFLGLTDVEFVAAAGLASDADAAIKSAEDAVDALPLAA
jgi:FMN-dependent NADH-azoreductase